MNFSENVLIAFFSANAQIFGALLGLLGLSYLRVTETIEQNVTQILVALIHDFTEELAKDKELWASEAHWDVDVHSMEKLFDEYRHLLSPALYIQFKSAMTARNLKWPKSEN